MITDELLVICDECWLMGDEWWMLNTQKSLWEHVGVHLRPWVIVMLFLTVFLTLFLTVFLQHFYHISAVLCYCCNFYSRDCVQGQDDGWIRSGADFLPLGTDHSFGAKIWARREAVVAQTRSAFLLLHEIPHQAGLAARVKIWKPLKLEEGFFRFRKGGGDVCAIMSGVPSVFGLCFIN